MSDEIPFLPLPRKLLSGFLHGLYPLSSLLLKLSPQLETDLEESESRIEAKEYLAGAIFVFAFYFLGVFLVLSLFAFSSPKMGPIVLFFAFISGCAMSSYMLLYPRLLSGKRKYEMEHNLLFAARHLMVQTSAGVPIFDSIVSISEQYGDATLDYGAISREFRNIVKDVRGGRDLALMLEESAERNPSQLYRRMMLQLANASRAGANIAFVLREVVNNLSNEQQVSIRKYGSQLNTLAMFYIFACIVAPALGVIFLAIAASLIDMPVSEPLFVLIFIASAGLQFLFIGLIKSRRPVVAL